MYKANSKLNLFVSIYRVAKAVFPTTKVSFSLIVTCALLAATSVAPATFVDLHLVQISTGTPSTGYTTYRLYAEFDDPNDQLTSVHGNTLPQSQISFGVAPNEFYQNPLCGARIQYIGKKVIRGQVLRGAQTVRNRRRQRAIRRGQDPGGCAP